MKAAVYDRYGPPEVVHIRDVPKPGPKANEILIKVHASTVSSADWRARSLDLPSALGPVGRPLGRLMFGILRPRQPILGRECAGIVEATGGNVTKFKVGDAVVAFLGKGGCHAEYCVAAQDKAIALKPDALSFADAAALSFGGATALDFLRRGNVGKGDAVLVVGASGAVGSAAVQLAKHFGAKVTAVTSGANAKLVKSLGAANVIDYTKTDFADGKETFDVILDTTGTVPTARARKALKPGGRRLAVLGGLSDMTASPSRKRGGITVVGGVAPERAEDVAMLADLAVKGAYKPLIDSTFALDDIVQAHRRVDTGRKRGVVVVTVVPTAAAEPAS